MAMESLQQMITFLIDGPRSRELERDKNNERNEFLFCPKICNIFL